MPRQSDEQIQAEIVALNELLPQMPAYSDGIKVSLRVLEHKLNSDSVFGAYEGSELFFDAHSALLWRDGDASDKPSDLYREMME